MLEYTICFILGVLTSWFLTYVMSLGHSITVLKQTQKSCAALLLVSEQGLHQILELKYISMEESGRSQQNITAQKYIDQMNIDSMKKAIIRNHVNAWPPAYTNILEFKSWDELEVYVDNVNKGEE